MNKVLVVGLGKMGHALAAGLKDAEKIELWGYDIHQQKSASLAKSIGLKVFNPKEEKMTFEYILLCVKPQDLESSASLLQSHVNKGSVIISILAGATLKSISDAFNGHKGVVRAMPNIAALVHEAATALAEDGALAEESRRFVQDMFERVGTCHFTREDLMDAVTGLSGSGPAYFYMMIEALADGGVKMGIPRRMALDLSVQTLLGAGKLLKDSGKHPAILREEVTTPGGTTIHAIQDLEERGLRAMLMSAVEKATRRSKKLRR